MIKRFFAVVLSLAMMISVLPVGAITAFAAETDEISIVSEESPVAKVGNTEYATIDEAIAAWSNGTTLTLLADVTLSDVIKLSSTEYHILDLGTYTMTAAENKDAIQYVINGRSSAGNALDIKADATNPGGITATGKAIVSHIKPSSGAPSKDRPITRFYGGVFTASYIVKQGGSGRFLPGAGYTGASAPHFYFFGGEYNGTIYTNRSLNQFHGGTFNGSMQMSVDSSSWTMIAGGRFKYLSNSMGSNLDEKIAQGVNNYKFTIGSAKATYDKEVYVDDEGYYVVTNADPVQGIEATVEMTPDGDNYFYYSKVPQLGMKYTDAEVALEKNKTATVTVYADELDMTDISFTGTIFIPMGESVKITNAPSDLKTDTVDGYEVVCVDGVYSSVVKKNYVAQIGDTKYESLQDAIDDANTDDTITFLADITEDVTIFKAVTIDGAKKNYTGTMNIGTVENITIQNVNFVKGCIDGNTSALSRKLTVKDCTFDGVDKSIGYAITVRHGASVVIENSSAENYSIGMLYVPQSVAAITVKDVTVSNVQAAFNITYSGDALFENVAFENVTYGIHFQIYGSRTYTVKNSDLSGATNPFWFWDKSNGTEKVTVVFEGENIVPGFQEISYTTSGVLKLATGASLTAPEGLTITTDAEGYEVVYENGIYSVAAKNYVAQIGDTKYESLQAAIDAAATTGDTIKLIDNILLNDINDVEARNALSNGNGAYCGYDYGNGAFFNVIAKDLTVDLNGYTITYDIHDDAWCNKRVVSLFYATDASKLNIIDSVGTGKVTVYGMATAVYSVAVDTEVTISGGTWTWNPCKTCGATNAFLYASHGGELYVTDGKFVNNVEGNPGEYMIFVHYSSKETTQNWAGVDYDGTKIEISGGTFENYNPGEIKYMDNGDKNKETLATGCAPNFAPIEITDGTYGIVAAVAKIGDTYYASLADAVKAVAENTTATPTTITLLKDQTIRSLMVGHDYAQNIIIDLNGYTLSSTDKTLTAYRAGTTLTLINGTVSGNSTGGTIQVTYGGKLVLGEGLTVKGAGGSATLIKVDNGIVDVCDTGVPFVGGKVDFGVSDNANNKVNVVASIGRTYYGTLAGAVTAAATGDTVVLLKDIALTEADCVVGADRKVLVDVVGKDITLDMNGKKISVEHLDAFTNDYIVAVIRVADGAGLTVTGNGTIDVKLKELDPDMAYMFWKRGTTGHLTVENGTFHMNDSADSMVYTNGNEIVNIKGGTWTLDAYGTRGNREPWIFNVKGAGDNHVLVTGGTFNADINSQFWSNEVVVPEKYYTVNNADGTWTVKEGAVAYVYTGMLTGPYFIRKNIGYATLEEAIAAAENYSDPNVTLLADSAVDLTIKKEIILDLNDFAFTGKIALADANATLTAPEGLDVTIDTNLENYKDYKIVYENGSYKLEEFKIVAKSATLIYNDIIRIRYRYKVTADVEEYGLLVFATAEDAATRDASKASETIKLNYNSQEGLYEGYSNGIPAKKMGDSQFVVGYAKLADGEYEYADVIEYSPKIYAKRMVEKADSKPETKKLCNALMAYGAAAQNYMSYKTDDLMNVGFEPVEYDATVLGGEVFRVDTSLTNGFKTKSANLVFEGAITYRVMYGVEDEISSKELYAEYTVKGMTKSVPLTLKDGTYFAYISGIAAKDMDEALVVKPYYLNDSNEKVYGAELVYSGYEYSRRTITNSSDSNSIALAKAFAMYVNAADEAISE